MKILLTFFLSLVVTTAANSAPIALREGARAGYCPGFTENKGQITDGFKNSRNDLLYLYDNKGLKLQIKNNALSYELYKITGTEAPDKVISAGLSIPSGKVEIISQRIDIDIVGANTNPQLLASNALESYTNYYNDANPDGVTFVRTYKNLLYKNLYNGIDLSIYTETEKPGKPKYDFILKPGADPAQVKLRYSGANSISLDGAGNLEIVTDLGTILEQRPYCYYSDNGQIIPSEFLLNNNILSFKLDDYDNSREIVIDPRLDWTTYYGGIGDDVGMELCADRNDNIIVTGYTNSVSQIATSGAYRQSLAGNYDAFLMKITDTCSLVWCTYYGGEDYDIGHAVACDKGNCLIMAGWTKSQTGIASNTAFKKTNSGSFDSFIARFRPNGIRHWCTYYGGDLDDYTNDITTDGKSNILLAGLTSSGYNIASSGAYQSDISGSNDGFIVKLDTNGNRLWGTYFGGTGFDVAMELKTDVSDRIYIVGYTQSNNGISTENAYQKTLAGDWDAFLSCFSAYGQRVWSTYFGGKLEDRGWGIAIGGSNNIFITGNTKSTEGIASPDAWLPQQQGEFDAFLARFDNNGNRIWSTYYGGNDNDFGNDICISPWSETWLAGETISLNGISTTDAFRQNYLGGTDGAIAKFSADGKRLWGTYFGGTDEDKCHSVALDHKGNAVVTGITKSNFISTANAFKTTYSGAADIYVAKIDISESSATITTDSLHGPYCAGSDLLIPFHSTGTFADTNSFIAQLSDINHDFDTYYDLGSIVTDKSDTIRCKLPATLEDGTYIVRIISTAPQHIGSKSPNSVEVYSLPDIDIAGPHLVCSQNIFTYSTSVANTSYMHWSAIDGTIIGPDSLSEVNVLWGNGPNVAIGLMKQNNFGCVDSIYQAIKVSLTPAKPLLAGETTVCSNISCTYTTPHPPSDKDLWRADNGIITDSSTPGYVVVKWLPKGTGKLTIIRTNPTGCSDSSYRNIEINSPPIFTIMGDTIVKSYTEVSYTTEAKSGREFIWSVSGGEILGLNNINVVRVKWDAPGFGKIKLVEKSIATQCADSIVDNVIIQLKADPAVLGVREVCSNSENIYIKFSSHYWTDLKWQVKGGSILGPNNSDTMRVRWEIPGMGQVKLMLIDTVTKSIDSAFADVRINALPELGIRGSRDVCALVDNQYSAITTNDVNSRWSIQNGEIFGSYTDNNIRIRWDSVSRSPNGKYFTGKLKLVQISKTTGCHDSLQLDINIFIKPKALISGSDHACTNNLEYYTTDSSFGAINLWSVNGGKIADSVSGNKIGVLWSKTGIGNVMLVKQVTSNCYDSTHHSLYVIESPAKPNIKRVADKLETDSSYGYVWYCNGILLEGYDRRAINAPQAGYYRVRLMNLDSCLSDYSDSLYSEATDVSDISESITVFPNPVTGFLTIVLPADDLPELISLRDEFGRSVATIDYGRMQAKTLSLDLSDKSASVYFLYFVFRDKVIIKKIIKY